MTNYVDERGRLVVDTHDEYGRYVKGAKVDEYGRAVGYTTGTGGGGGGTTPSAWRSAELYGGGVAQTISFDPLGTRVIIGGESNGVSVSTDGGVNWVPAIGGYKDSDARKRVNTAAVLWSRNTSSPNRVWNGNAASFMVSNNSGLDWIDVPNWPGVFAPGTDSPHVSGHCIDDDGVGHIYIVDNTGDVYRYTPNNPDGTNTGATTFKRIARLGQTGTTLYLDPLSPTTTLFVGTRGEGSAQNSVYQIENIQTNTQDGATVRTYTGTGSPNQCEELVAVNESGTVKLYAASMANVRRVARATLGGSGNITTAWDTITPPIDNNQLCAIDAVRSGGSTLLVVGHGPTPPLTSNGSAEIYYAADGHAASPTWQLLTGDDATSDFVNAMGGPGGKLWWGDGIRSGATAGELSDGRWIDGAGAVEAVAFDPVHTNRIIGVGQSGAWFFDTASKKAYPAMVGVMSERSVAISVDPADEQHIVITGSGDASHTTKTGGAGGDWRKNDTQTSPGSSTGFFRARFLDGVCFAGGGDQFLNQSGTVYFNADATTGTGWAELGFFSAVGGSRPLGLAARTISGSWVLLAAVQDKGIYKSTWTPGGLPTGGTWVKQTAPGAFNNMGAGPGDGWLRSVPIYFVSSTVAYAFDPTSGVWRSNDAGVNWSNIWQATCPDNFGGTICTPDDAIGTIYVALSDLASGANIGVWKLTNADSPGATVENGQIAKTKLTRPDGTNFGNPVTIACQMGGKVFVVDLTTDTSPRGYLSTNSGATWTDITDTYFSRSVRRVVNSVVTPTGRIFVVGNGTGTVVYDTNTSVGGDGTTSATGTISRRVLLQWAVTDPTGTSFTSDVTQATGDVNRLLVAHVFNSGDSVNHALAPTSLTGLGLTWTQRKTENVVASDLTERQITTFTAMTQAGGTTGSLVATFAAAQTGCAIHVTEYANVNTSGGGGLQTVATNVPSPTTNDSTDGTVYTYGPFTPTANAVIALVIRGVRNTASPVISSITDSGGRTWTVRSSNADVATDQYLTALYTANAGASPSSTTITVTFAATMTGCDMKVVEMLNCDTTTPVPSGQTSSGQTPTSTTTPSSSLPNPPAPTSMILTVEGLRANPAGITDESGWSLVIDTGHGTPNNGLHVATRQGDQFWTGTLVSSAKVTYLIAEFQGAAAPVGDPVVQSNSANWGSTPSKPTLSLSSSLSNAGNAVEYASVTPRSPAAWDPETGWLELWDSGYLQPSTGPHVAGQIGTNDNSFASPIGTNDRWGATILEIGVGSGGAVTTDVSVVSFDYNVGIAHEVEVSQDEIISSVSLNLLTSGSQSTDGTSFPTASVSPTSGRTVYAAVESSATATPPVPSVSGNGLTWTQVDTIVWDSGTTSDRRRLTIFKGVGTPSSGAVTFTFSSTQTGVIWFVIESNGSVLQTVKGSVAASSQIQLGLTPLHANGTTFLSFLAKKGTVPTTNISNSAYIFPQAINNPNSVMTPIVTSVANAITLTANSSDVQDQGLMAMELAAAQTSEDFALFDFIISGAPIVVPGKKHPRKQKLFKVYATFDGIEVPLQSNWEFAENAFGGYDTATLSLPERFARSHPNLIDQDSPVTFWNEAGVVLWQGLVKQPPDFGDGLANLQCEGPQHAARGVSDRLMYQIVGTEGWATGDADPFTLRMDKLYDVSTDFGRLLVKRTRVDSSTTTNKDMFQTSDRAGWVMWAQDVDITRVAYVLRKSDDLANFELNNYLDDGPNPTIGAASQVASFALGPGGVADGTEKIMDQLAGNHDLFAIMINCTADNTKPNSNENVWLQDIRVNGLADDDNMTTTQIAKDIADRMGWESVDVVSQDTNGLPFDTEGTDWGSALDYMSQLDNTTWQAYGDEQDGVVFRRQSWGAQQYDTSVESGAEVDLTPESIFDTVSVIWKGASGKKHTETLSQGNGKIYPPVEMSDTQRDNDNAQVYAQRLLDEYGSLRYSGTITLTNGDREMHAGRNVNVSDWDQGKSLNHQISDITQTEDGIKLGIRWPAIVSNYLARLQHKTKSGGR